MKPTLISLNATSCKNVNELAAEILNHIPNNPKLREGLSGKNSKTLSMFHMKTLLRLHCSNTTILIFLDEIDHALQNSSKEEIESFLTIFRRENNGPNLGLIGASNRIDLIFELKAQNKLSLTTIENVVFKPYTNDEISDILKRRIHEAFECDENFEWDNLNSTELKEMVEDNFVLNFVAKKVTNNKKSDVRQAFDLCRKVLSEKLNHAVEEVKKYAEARPIPAQGDIVTEMATGTSTAEKPPHAQPPQLRPNPKGDMSTVLTVCDAFFNSTKKAQDFIHDLTLSQLLVLQSIYQNAAKKSGAKADAGSVMDIPSIIEYYNKVCQACAVPKINNSQLKEIFEVLETYNLIQITKNGKKPQMVVKIMMELSSLRQLLMDNPYLSKFIE